MSAGSYTPTEHWLHGLLSTRLLTCSIALKIGGLVPELSRSGPKLWSRIQEHTLGRLPVEAATHRQLRPLAFNTFVPLCGWAGEEVRVLSMSIIRVSSDTVRFRKDSSAGTPAAGKGLREAMWIGASPTLAALIRILLKSLVEETGL